MEFSIYQVDAFAQRRFEGNPAAVVPLDGWLPDTLLQQIAQENNLAETAFFVPEGDRFRLRWFTPSTEVALCGHATLATAHVLFEHLGYPRDPICFESRSGELRVSRKGDRLELNFPAAAMTAVDDPAVTAAVTTALGRQPLALWQADDLVAVFESQADVLALAPDFRALGALETRGVAATASGDQVDFVCRFFAPQVGIDEDPVTGSLYCLLAPFWAGLLGRTALSAAQLSKRGGRVWCEVLGDRVAIAGTAVTYLVGKIQV